MILISSEAAKHRRGTFLLLGFLVFSQEVFAQSPPSQDQERPVIAATRVEEVPTIDELIEYGGAGAFGVQFEGTIKEIRSKLISIFSVLTSKEGEPGQ